MAPEGWAKLSLESRLGLLPGYAFKSNLFSDDPSIGLPLIRIRDLITQKPTAYYAGEPPSDYLVRLGDVLIGMDGEFEIRKWSGSDGLLNQRVCKIWSLKPDEIDQEFLFYRLAPELANLQNTITRTTVKHLSTRHLKALRLTLPPLREQKKIAAILGSVDEAIQATQAVIDQTRKVKQGLLQQLLTRGIGHTRFKQTEIGEIPAEWNVVTLKSLLADVPNAMRSGPFGSSLRKEELVAEGVPFLGIDNVLPEQFVGTFKRFVSEEKFRELKRYAVRDGDVMITIMGTVGRCCVVPSNTEPALSSKHVWTMTFDSIRYPPELLCWQLNHAPWVRREFTRIAQGGVMSAITSSVLKCLLLPMPTVKELREMYEVFKSVQVNLKRLEPGLSVLHSIKRGLMQNLLTGSVRVASCLPYESSESTVALQII